MHCSEHPDAAVPCLASPELRAVVPAVAGLPLPSAPNSAPGGLSPPHKNEAPDTVAAGRGGDQGTTINAHSALQAHTGQALDGKAFATLRARLALAGYVLSRIVVGNGEATYSAARWGRVADLHDLAAVEAFAARVGAPS